MPPKYDKRSGIDYMKRTRNYIKYGYIKQLPVTNKYPKMFGGCRLCFMYNKMYENVRNTKNLINL